MKFNKCEQETVMVFDMEKGCWCCFTNVPSHIQVFTSKVMEVSGLITILAEHEGTPTAIQVSLFKEDINLREALKKQCVMSEV
ncbi:hypothetical protein BAMA_13035 [Bacillus manliponensis]|uniref:Uncharacterized protein n=1 Tax=Bacillus manliponensis TaxID=574376 RepID=A0A073JT26_9BACI|nr:hypothetical protein [Bacillus manliponensis]KEK17425.1 hypothetical protein BAMA_13035 [Bacillus manliponensis]